MEIGRRVPESERVNAETPTCEPRLSRPRGFARPTRRRRGGGPAAGLDAADALNTLADTGHELVLLGSQQVHLPNGFPDIRAAARMDPGQANAWYLTAIRSCAAGTARSLDRPRGPRAGDPSDEPFSAATSRRAICTRPSSRFCPARQWPPSAEPSAERAAQASATYRRSPVRGSTRTRIRRGSWGRRRLRSSDGIEPRRGRSRHRLDPRCRSSVRRLRSDSGSVPGRPR